MVYEIECIIFYFLHILEEVEKSKILVNLVNILENLGIRIEDNK